MLGMARKTKTEKLETIKEQLERLQKEHDEIEQDLFKEVGKYVTKKLNSTNLDEIKAQIDALVQYDLNHTDNAKVKNEDEPAYNSTPNQS